METTQTGYQILVGYFICNILLSILRDQVLRRPVEIATQSGHVNIMRQLQAECREFRAIILGVPDEAVVVKEFIATGVADDLPPKHR